MVGSVKRIVVATDGSAPAGRGVGWAGVLAGTLGAELVVTTVLGAGGGGFDVGEAPSQEDRDRVVGLLEGPWSAPARGDTASVSTVVLEGDPRVALLDAVTVEHADLLVLGATGTGWFPAPHLGHVAHAVAQHCTVPLIVVPPGAPAHAPDRVLVGIDGSVGCAAAVAWTASVAGALPAEVVAVHAHMRERVHGRDPRYVQLESDCHDWSAPLRAAGVATRIVIAQGWPPSALMELEAVEAPGLVVLGARGTGGFPGLRLGSVALGVLQHSVVPVAIVPDGSGPSGGHSR